ncbi:hypothetical protein J4E83_005142 [Alternaria metachromatica]|uniref:uncharacterized protein n=1 Tax=Alternaria metachromatica TaxID=283354 RepID=UPI0020C4D910|nr:uncharacterized protein J4E83_005142 [Alternaria metachromatica]KAI4620781.1 hypothetical protein J4E83_005142 [Alternaria metachromatica]
MASSRNNRTATSTSRNITGIVDTYASPTMGSSPAEYSRRSYDPILSGRGHGDVSMSSSPSPSPYPLSNSRRANLHQSTSTHSGYLDRAQLFGRTPIQQNTRRARPPSTSNERNIRKRSSRTPTGEWAEAGLPEPPIEASRVSLENAEGLVCTPTGITTLDVEEDTPGRFSPSAQLPATCKTSPAEDALREQFEKGRVELARNLAWRSSSNGKSKCAGRSFDTNREGCVSPKTPTNVSEDEESEFGYVDPASVRDVLARVKAREATGRTHSLFDSSQHIRNRDEPSESYFDVGIPRRNKNALFADSPDADMALPKLPDRRVFSLVEPPPMKTPTRKRPSPVSSRAELSFSPILAAIDVTPRPTSHDLAITPVTTHLTLSTITITLSQPPTPPRSRTGLTFSQATAIIYGCMTITASHQALLGLGGDIAAMDLIIGLFGAFLLGLAICVVLKMLLGARLRRVPRDVLR